jgi:hypothetical protein
MNEMVEAAILGGANDDDIEESVHHFISNFFWSNHTQTFLNCQTVDVWEMSKITLTFCGIRSQFT